MTGRSGRPCNKGHAFGRTRDGHCIECERLRGHKRYAEDPSYRARAVAGANAYREKRRQRREQIYQQYAAEATE